MINLSRRAWMNSMIVAGASSLSSGKSSFTTWLINAAQKRSMQSRMLVTQREACVDSLRKYLGANAPKLLRPAGALRYPSISPSPLGGAYATQLWDWDTLWTSRGLFGIAKALGDDNLHQRVADHARGSLFNFFEAQSDQGRIPIMIDDRNSDFFGSCKKERPNKNNQAKPVFGQLALLIAEELRDATWFGPRFDQLLRFYDSWLRENQALEGLFVWGNDVAIGDDNDPTTFGRPFCSSANLLLNCLFYEDLMAAADVARRLNRHQEEKLLSERAINLRRQIQKYCWDPRDRFFYTVDVQCVDRRAELIPGVPLGMPMSWRCLPIRIQMFTGFLPMWCGIATPQQASDLVNLHYLNKETFHGASGVRSLSARETMYSLATSGNPSNWLGPVWIIVNYFVWKGLQAYGFETEARALADTTLELLARDLAKSGTLNEYYHPDNGAPLSVKEFMDWNLLVSEMM